MHNSNWNHILRSTLYLPSITDLCSPWQVPVASLPFRQPVLLCLVGKISYRSLYSFFRGTKVYVLGIVSALAPVLYASWDLVLLMLISRSVLLPQIIFRFHLPRNRAQWLNIYPEYQRNNDALFSLWRTFRHRSCNISPLGSDIWMNKVLLQILHVPASSFIQLEFLLMLSFLSSFLVPLLCPLLLFGPNQ